MDEQAARLEQLYREIGPDIRAYLRRRLIDSWLADELLQETFLIATRDAASLEAAGSPRAWLLGIARNLFREHVRKAARRRTVELPDDVAENPATEADHRLDLIRSAIGELPEAQREVLALRLKDDLCYAEIAEMLGIPIGTVRSRLHQALRRLRLCLMEQGEVGVRGVKKPCC
jgi:RNA polymerase sigma-70 factor (ECF subfamily)